MSTLIINNFLSGFHQVYIHLTKKVAALLDNVALIESYVKRQEYAPASPCVALVKTSVETAGSAEDVETTWVESTVNAEPETTCVGKGKL